MRVVVHIPFFILYTFIQYRPGKYAFLAKGRCRNDSISILDQPYNITMINDINDPIQLTSSLRRYSTSNTTVLPYYHLINIVDGKLSRNCILYSTVDTICIIQSLIMHTAYSAIQCMHYYERDITFWCFRLLYEKVERDWKILGILLSFCIFINPFSAGTNTIGGAQQRII